MWLTSLAVLLGPGPSLAFEPPSSLAAWPRAAFPLPIEVWTEGCPAEAGACLRAAEAAAAGWAQAPCVGLDVVVSAASASPLPTFGDGISQLVYGDPRRALEPEEPYRVFASDAEVDFVFAAGLPFATPAEIREGACYQQLNLDAWTAFAMGHQLRLRPVVPDPLDPPSMFWAMGLCDGTSGILGQAFPRGALRGEPGFTVDCDPVNGRGLLLGRAPFEVTCEVRERPPDGLFRGIDSVRWDCRDGTTGEGLTVSHVFEERGIYQIVARSEVDGEACDVVRGVVTSSVTVCGRLDPRLEVVPTEERRTVQIVNENPPGGPGCEDEAQWRVFDVDAPDEPVLTTVAWSPRLELPRAGTYLAEVTVTAADGASATGQVRFDVEGGVGCTTRGPAGPRGVLALALSVVVFFRRRGLGVVRALGSFDRVDSSGRGSDLDRHRDLLPLE